MDDELRRSRDAIISPYIAQNWVLVVDYPNEKRVELRREWTVGRTLTFLILIIIGATYYAFLLLVILFAVWMYEKKKLMY